MLSESTILEDLVRTASLAKACRYYGEDSAVVRNNPVQANQPNNFSQNFDSTGDVCRDGDNEADTPELPFTACRSKLRLTGSTLGQVGNKSCCWV